MSEPDDTDADLWQQVSTDLYKFRWLLEQARKVGPVPSEIPRLGFPPERKP